jgi:hypothetical protein
MPSACAMRSKDPSDGETCPNSTCERKLAENPTRAANARNENCRCRRAALSLRPTRFWSNDPSDEALPAPVLPFLSTSPFPSRGRNFLPPPPVPLMMITSLLRTHHRVQIGPASPKTRLGPAGRSDQGASRSCIDIFPSQGVDSGNVPSFLSAPLRTQRFRKGDGLSASLWAEADRSRPERRQLKRI